MNRVDEIVRLIRKYNTVAYASVSDEVLTTLIRREWQSGQWSLITGNAGALMGWVSYYWLDDDSLAYLKERGFMGCVIDRYILTSGPHIYMANCVTHPDSPANTYRQLYKSVVSSFPDATSYSFHMMNRRGGVRWVCRTNEQEQRYERIARRG